MNWFDEKVFYQIYPLGAAGAPFENDHQLTHRLNQFEAWIKPLKERGIGAILFNPLFESITHGYDTTDYRKVDSRLGDNEDLKKLVEKIHDNDMKVVYDAVFNHVGREFPPFQDVLKNRENSKYKDWFFIDFNGNNGFDDHLYYENWEGNEPLVRLNLKNPEVIQYHLDSVDFWMDELGADGLRLDVAYCLDHDFMKALHQHVKAKNPEFFLLGEMVHGDYNTIANPEMLDSATNYECQKGIYSSLNSKNFYEILYSFNRQFGKENWCLYTGKNLLSFLDNHDVNRIASVLENKDLLPAAYAILMTMPGIPCIYYGSEWGIEGMKNQNDTEIRPEVEIPVTNELSEIVAKLAKIHTGNSALQNGDYTQIAINNPWCIYQRSNDEQTIWTCINIDKNPVDIPVNYQGQTKNLFDDQIEEVNGQIHLEPGDFKILELSA
ncbi:alpha-amylase family glycosyl hydrolase [Ileibacterium valens]|uniref:alpha-amylase family glycosyl hydrolase n=1 Tax=Ileibacterium valens TaxID=1862668 RepID=UPI00259B2E4A|nr:alpha-amylase family glycosyl hydrolase [Ileibacterium valens]